MQDPTEADMPSLPLSAIRYDTSKACFPSTSWGRCWELWQEASRSHAIEARELRRLVVILSFDA